MTDRLPSTPRDDRIFLAVVALVAAAITAINTLTVADDLARAGRSAPAWQLLILESSSALALVALAPAILALTRRVWPLQKPWARAVGLHIVGAMAFSLLHVALMGALRGVAYPMLGGRYDPLGPLGDWPYEFRKDLLTYASIVALYVGWRLIRAPRSAEPAPGGALEVRDGARRHFVPLADVAWIEAAGNYVELHRGLAPILHRATLAEMERQLKGAGFVRIHRSRLVRRDAVAQVESKASGDFLVRLTDGRELAGSRRFRRALLES